MAAREKKKKKEKEMASASLTFAFLLGVAAHPHRRPAVGDALTGQDKQRDEMSPFFHAKKRCYGGLAVLTQMKVLMSAVSWRPVRRRSLPSPYAAMCSR